MESNINSTYKNWLAALLDLNRNTLLQRDNLENVIIAQYNARIAEVEKYKKQSEEFASGCNDEIFEMMSKVNKHLVSYGRYLNPNITDCHIASNDINVLVTEIKNCLNDIRQNGSIFLSKKPAKWQNDLYDYLISRVSYAYAAIRKYQLVANNIFIQRCVDLDNKKRSAISEMSISVREKAFPTLSQLIKHPVKNDYSGLIWENESWNDWKPTASIIPSMVRLGEFYVDNPLLDIRFPAYIPFQYGNGIYYKTSPVNYQYAVKSAKSLMIRLLLSTQPGKIEFTFVDPNELGGSISELLPIADIDPDLINKYVFSSNEQISKKLSMLAEQIKTIQQLYLRTDFDSIEGYNDSAKIIAEPYRIIYINNFPERFNSESIRDLNSIATNGPKCGIYPIIIAKVPYEQIDTKQISDIENKCTLIDMTENQIHIDDPRFDLYNLLLDASPVFSEISVFKEAIKKVAEHSLLNKKVEYTFSDMLIREGIKKESWWSCETSKCIEAPMGPSGAKRILNLRLGLEMGHSVLCVGRPGSGKSNLMSVIITSLSLKYSPEELQLYLIDLKSGVTFKKYEENLLPHGRVIAVDSDREFALVVLEGLEQELQRRGKEFRDNSVTSVSEYRNKTNTELPRILLMVDEFQDLFINMDGINNKSTRILERLIREGRQLGIHIFLGTQSLAGVSLPKAILDLIAIRIALQCSDAESRVILAEDNSAAKLLKKPGEAIFNDGGGIADSNIRFQVAYYTNDDDKYLKEISNEFKSRGKNYGNILYNGSLPNRLLDISVFESFMKGDAFYSGNICAWLGKPVNIEEFLRIDFKKQIGDNLSIISSDRDEGNNTLLAIMMSFSIYNSESRPLIYLNSNDEDDSDKNAAVSSIAEIFKDDFIQVKRRGLGHILETLAALVKSEDVKIKKKTFLIIDAIHKNRDFENDYTSENEKMRDNLLQIIRYGPDIGIHVIVSSESFERFTGIFGRYISEFNMRIAGIMDSNSSMMYIADINASRIEKANRLVLYKPNASGNKYVQFIPYEKPKTESLKKFIEQVKKCGVK